ncbi:EthD domain-containing protein, partial [Rhizobium multihospitium]
MIVRFGLLTRRQDLSPEEFSSYWRGTHAEVVRSTLPELNGYIQNHVVDRSQKGIDYQRVAIEVDGMAQLFFPSLAETRGFSDETKIRALQSDEENFLGGIAILTAFQNVVVEPPRSGKFAKRMSLIRKRSDTSMQQFQD